MSEDVVLNIRSVNAYTKDGIFEGSIHLNVHSAEDVNFLCAKIAKVDGINTVHRSTI